MKKTLRLVFPQWEGGNNPDYVFGAELLACIAPADSAAETVEIAVNRELGRQPAVGNGIIAEANLLRTLDAAAGVLESKNPDRVIVFGGDCSISQAPFDYLNGRYGGELGILWLDAHPDVAGVEDTTRLHEMVLGNLIGGGAPAFAKRVKSPVKPGHVMLAGLQHGELRPKDEAVNTMRLLYAGPAELAENSLPVTEWIERGGIRHVAVHFDLDVLSPADFRSTYPAQPYLKEFGAAVGEMTLAQIVRLMRDVSAQAEIVGFSIAEHMPWDAMNLRKALSEISIFGQ